MDFDKLKTTDTMFVSGKRVLVRADLNVPMQDGVVSDATRLSRLVPGLQALAARGEFVQRALAVPAARRCAGVPDKPFEWEIAAPVLGEGYPRRRKQGFIFPFEHWLRDGAGLQAVRAGLTSAARVEAAGLRPAGVLEVMAPFFAGSRSIPWSRPWALHVLLDWCARHRVHL